MNSDILLETINALLILGILTFLILLALMPKVMYINLFIKNRALGGSLVYLLFCAMGLSFVFGLMKLGILLVVCIYVSFILEKLGSELIEAQKALNKLKAQSPPEKAVVD